MFFFKDLNMKSPVNASHPIYHLNFDISLVSHFHSKVNDDTKVKKNQWQKKKKRTIYINFYREFSFYKKYILYFEIVGMIRFGCFFSF